MSGGATLGSRGYAKVTYIHRTMTNFVEDFFTLDTGVTTITEDGQNFGTFVNQLYRNTDALDRGFDGLMVQTRYRVAPRLLFDGSWTVQLRNEGNFVGETSNQPAISSSAFDWPEITPAIRYFPSGRLDSFQRHKVRVWGIYTLGLGRAGDVDIGGLWRYNSGRVFSLRAANQRPSATQQAIIQTLGYPSGPSPRDLYFSPGRGSEQFKGYGLFDLSFQYGIPVWQSLKPWIRAEIYNVLNNDGVIRWNTTITPDTDGPVDELGLPTRYIEGPRFGQATSPNHYPQYSPGQNGLRTIRVALGLSF